MPDLPQVGLEAVLITVDFEKGAVVIEKTMKEVVGTLDEAEDSSGGAGSALDALGGIATGVATGGVTLLLGVLTTAATALLGLSTAGLRFASEFSGVMKDVGAQTGATGEELDAFRDIAEEVFVTGLGESFGDVAQAMVQVEQITGAVGEELQELTTDALIMSQVFDVDVGESIRAADQAMIAFGADGSQVFDLLTTTIQNTGDPMDDLADTVNEYSTIFAEAGFSVEEMFGVLNSGLEAGAFNFDKVGDAIKEFFVRLEDGSETTSDALNELFAEPGDEAVILTDRIAALSLELEDQEIAVDAARVAMEEAKGAWATTQQVVKDLESALSAARNELNELSRPNLAGMEAFDDQIFNIEQNVKRARLAMLDMQADTPEFEAAQEQLDGMNKEMEKLRLARDIEFDAQFRAIEDAVSAGTEEVLTFDQAMAEIAARKGDIEGLEGALWNAQQAERAAAKDAKSLNMAFQAATGNFALTEEAIGFLSEELEATGTPAQKFLDALGQGAITGPEAMSKVIKALKEVEDPIKQNQIGVALFGSMWEDLGSSVVLAMDPAQLALQDVTGATDKAGESVGTGLGGAWEKLKRVMQVILADGFEPVLGMLVENLTPAFQLFADWLKGPGQEVLNRFAQLLTDNLTPALAEVGPFIEDKLIPILEDLAEWFIEDGLPAVQDFINWVIKKGIPELKKFIDFIVKKVIPFLKKLIDPFKPIREAIQETIEKFEQMKEDVGKFLDDLLNKVEEILSDIASFFTETLADILTDVVQWGRDLISEWADFLGDLLSDVIQWGRDLVSEWADFLSDLLSDVMQWGRDLISEWVDFLGDLLSDVIQWGADLISEWADFLSDLLSDVAQWGADLIAEWASFLSDLLSDIVAWGADLIAEFGQILADVLSDIVQFGQDLVSEFTEFLNDAVQEVISFADDMLEAASQMMQGLIDGITGAADSVTSAVSDVVSGAITALENALAAGAELGARLLAIGEGIIGHISDAITEHGPEVQSALENVVDFAAEQLEILLGGEGNIVQRLLTVGQNIINTMIDGLENLIGNEHPILISIRDIINNAIDSIIAAVGDLGGVGKDIIQAGKDIVQRIIDGVTSMAGAFFNALVGVINDAIEDIFGVRPFAETRSGGSSVMANANAAGQSISFGIAQGILDGASTVAAAAVFAVNNALAAANAAAGISSPSTLFAAVGHDLMTGLQAGIVAEIPNINATVQAAITAPALATVQGPVLSGGSVVTNNFNVGGNTINSGVDEAVFEARVIRVLQRNLSGAGSGLL